MGQSIQEKKGLFVQNMRQILAVTQLNLRQIATSSGIGDDGYRWLRRAARNGIHGPTKRNRHWLNELMRFLSRHFRIAQIEDFWSEDLIPSYLGRLIQNSSAEPSGEAPSNEDAIEMLGDLLTTREFGYLRMLIKDLYILRFEKG